MSVSEEAANQRYNTESTPQEKAFQLAKTLTPDSCLLSLPFFPSWHLCQMAADENMVPKLGGDDGRQTQLNGKTREGTGRHLSKSPSPMMDRRDIKIARLS